jgi:predicted phosphodiesterase
MKLGIISDIHEDVENLKKAFHVLEKNSCENIACLGDIVGFCVHYDRYSHNRDAKECLRLVKQNCNFIVVGNHDLFAAAKIPEYRGGFDFPHNWYSLSFKEKEQLSSGRVWLYHDELPSNLNEEDLAYIRSLPEFLKVNISEIRFMFSHFVLPDLTGSPTSFPKNIKSLSGHFEFMNQNECTISFCGHIHAEGMMLAYENKKHFTPMMQDLVFIRLM